MACRERKEETGTVCDFLGLKTLLNKLAFSHTAHHSGRQRLCMPAKLSTTLSSHSQPALSSIMVSFLSPHKNGGETDG